MNSGLTKDVRLSQNFTLAELVKSSDAIRLGIDNTPNLEQIDNLRNLAVKVLQPVRDKFGSISPSSGFRSQKLNTAIGGAKNSDHMKGFAADIESQRVSNYDLACWIRDNLEFTQVILEFYVEGDPNSGWVHVSYDPKNLKKECLTAVKRQGRTVYLQGLIK
jgi:zinc D-Ala-D-Ala carboxypeptidase